jgi:hypothetical protein
MIGELGNIEETFGVSGSIKENVKILLGHTNRDTGENIGLNWENNK